MTTSKPWRYEVLKNPHIKKLLRDMERLPEWLKNEERKYYEAQRFAKAVFGEAVEKSGLLKKLKG